jgi:hypothetical protein
LNVEELAREIAEKILFSHVTDIESLTVWEMTSDHIQYDGDDALKATFEDEERYDELCDTVFKQLDKVVVGISWDEGKTWQW